MSKKKKAVILSIITIFLTIAICLGITYAMWSRTYEQTNDNVVSTGCFNIDYAELTNAIRLDNVYPIIDNDGMELDPFTFKMENTCDITAEYAVKIEITSNTTMPLSSAKVALDNNLSIINSNQIGVSSLTKSGVTITDTYIIYTGYLHTGETKTHDVRMWLDENAPQNTSSNKILESYITIEAVATNKENNPKLVDQILAQGGGSTAIEAKGDPEFNAVPTAATSGLYATTDHYGTSYYYRGERDSLDNNIIFAGFQWKIVRINGDSSVRLIYNGTEEQFNTNGTINNQNEIVLEPWKPEFISGQTEFNKSTLTDNRGVGYMYGNTSATVAEVQTNTNDSEAKTSVDVWYENTILPLGTNITSKIADNLFCNDRSIASGTGAGSEGTTYKPFTRHQLDPMPTLICEQKNDRFTVSDTTIGNGDLTYPVGLITVDELVYAGYRYDFPARNLYINTAATHIWTMSPTFSSHYIGIVSLNVWWPTTDGNGLSTYNVDGSLGYFPVLNLEFSVKVSGSGSATDPFIVI